MVEAYKQYPAETGCERSEPKMNIGNSKGIGNSRTLLLQNPDRESERRKTKRI